MPKEEWGTKRLCPSCMTRFYDLNKDPMTCPACGNSLTVESLQAGRSRSLIAEKTPARGRSNNNDVESDEDLDDDSDDVDLDDDLLEDDDDDNVSLDDIADVAENDDES